MDREPRRRDGPATGLHPDYDSAFLGWMFRELGVREEPRKPGWLLDPGSGRAWFSAGTSTTSGPEGSVRSCRSAGGRAGYGRGSSRISSVMLEEERVECAPGSASSPTSLRGCLSAAASSIPSGYRLARPRARPGTWHMRSVPGTAFFSRLDGDWWLGLQGERFSPADLPRP